MMHDTLKRYFDEHGITQQQIADALGVSLQYVNQLLNGRKSLGKKNAERLANLYGLSKPFLLTGEGSLVLGKSEDAAPKVEREPIGIMDQSSLINAALAAKDETIESLKRELKTKDDLISTLKARIADLESRLATSKYTKLSDYPFEVGVAEP